LKTCLTKAETFVEGMLKNKNISSAKLSESEMFSSDKLDREFRHVVTGDTDSIFITYKRFFNKTDKTEDDILKEIFSMNNVIQNYLNDSVICDILKLHNVSIENNRLEMKNEFVIKRGLFLAKKRYGISIIAQENNRVDEMKAMGLEIKRSDFGSMTKEYLKDLLSMLLKIDKKTIIPESLKYVKEKENLFLKSIMNGEKEIARPVSYTKRLEQYKVIPQGPRSMENWNDLEYKAFGVGTRGYMFKIDGIDMDKAPAEVYEKYNKNFVEKNRKLEIIAVPESEMKLPDYYIINKKEMLKFAWTDRYSLLLEPILKTDKQSVLTF